MNEKWSQPTGADLCASCRILHNALKLMAPINWLDLSYHTRVNVREISWKEVSFNSFLCEPVPVWLHWFLRQYLFGSKISFGVEGMDCLRGNSIQYAAHHQCIFGSITICYGWWRIHLVTVCLSPAYISNKLSSELRYLAIYFPANIPWPMTDLRWQL
jgi:hypothetical protein